MRSRTWPMAFALVVLGASCSRDGGETARLSADLEKDLASASAASLELAAATRGYQPMRFVSDIEQVANAKPVPQRPKPRPVATNHASHEQPEAAAPDPTPAEQAAVVPEQESEPPVESAPAPRTPSVAPRPAPVPVDMAAGSGGGGAGGIGSREGPDWGTVVGVILRGGTVDPGHCPPRRRPRAPRIEIRIP